MQSSSRLSLPSLSRSEFSGGLLGFHLPAFHSMLSIEPSPFLSCSLSILLTYSTTVGSKRDSKAEIDSARELPPELPLTGAAPVFVAGGGPKVGRGVLAGGGVLKLPGLELGGGPLLPSCGLRLS